MRRLGSEKWDMKILHILLFPLQGSGSGVYTDQLAETLARRGHQVRVLCCGHAVPERPYPVAVLLFNNGTHQEYTLDFNFPAFTTHPASPTTTFGTLTAAQRAAYLAAFRTAIVQEVTAHPPDLVHVHHGWVIAPVVAELQLPYLISLHGTEYLGFFRYPWYQPWALRGLRGAWLVLAHTEADREAALLAYGLEPERVVVLPGGVDTAVFCPQPVDKAAVLGEYGIAATDRPVILYGGKLTAIKGVDSLLQAAQQYEASKADPLTLIAGDGDLRTELEQQARAGGLQAVHFLGHQSREQMIRLFNLADVVALPSRTESFPLVAMEAVACGTPLVASAVGGLLEIVRAPWGRLVPPDDPSALAAALLTMIQAGRAAAVRQAAAAYAAQHFSWETTVDRVEALYGHCQRC